MYNNISFFPNLNALRFFAALLVVFHHGETIRSKNGFTDYLDVSFFMNGGSAVKFFFVLSGFLITYILLKEKQQHQHINIGSFYLKRIFRIWPLYFLLVAIGIILFPILFQALHINYTFPYTFAQSWYLFLLFIPSIVTLNYGSHLLEPLWSIGVEEWFYLLWAPLFRWIQKPLIFIFAVLLVKTGLLVSVHYHFIDAPFATHLIKTYAFESMAFGGLGAYFLFYTKKNITSIYHKYRILNIFLIALTLAYILFNTSTANLLIVNFFQSLIFNGLISNILFLNLIIYCAMILPKTSWLNHKWLDLGGRISYGIYMYHMLVIFTIMHFLKSHLLPLSPSLSFIIFYGFVIGGTILIAYLSKKYFEDYFMLLRNRLK